MQMGKRTGFRIGVRLVKVFKWCLHRRTRRRAAAHQRLQPPSSNAVSPISKLCKWVCSLKRGARPRSLICSGKGESGYIRAGQDPFELLHESVPKGHLAVYVGDQMDDTCRVLVPVIYFNHPFFGELLKEAESVYGFDHPRGIQIPCPKSQFEIVQMKIAAARGGGRWRRRWS